jgi:hypothetical protein
LQEGWRILGRTKVCGNTNLWKENAMKIKGLPSSFILGAVLLAVASCATQESLQGYATKDDLSALRTELLGEIRKAQDSARAAEESSAASAAAAQRAAEDARAASEKADAIFRKSVRK